MTLKIYGKLEKRLICCFKNDKNFDLSTQDFQNFYFDWFLLCKVYFVWPKKSRGVIFHDTEEWWQSLKKLVCGLENDKRNMSNIHQSTWKISKLGLWWDPFIESRKCMSLKFTDELCVMTMKNGADLKRNGLAVSKLIWVIWRILPPTLKSPTNLHFNLLTTDVSII